MSAFIALGAWGLVCAAVAAIVWLTGRAQQRAARRLYEAAVLLLDAPESERFRRWELSKAVAEYERGDWQ